MLLDHPYLTVLIVAIAVLVIENLPIERLQWREMGWTVHQFQGKYFVFLWSRHDNGRLNVQLYRGCKCDDCKTRRRGR